MTESLAISTTCRSPLAYLSEVTPCHPETEVVARVLDELDVVDRTRVARREIAAAAQRR